MMQVEVRLTVNGKPMSATVARDLTLLRYLRDHLRLTGTKCGCDMGQGAASVLAQIAAAATGIPVETFSVVEADSEGVPAGAMAIGQRQTMIAGNATIGAAKKLKKLILDAASRGAGLRADDLGIRENHVVNKNGDPVVSLAQFRRLTDGMVLEAKHEWIAPQTYPPQGRPEPHLPYYEGRQDRQGV